MTMTGLKVFDETVHATNTWLHEITARMGWEERQRGYRLLRLVLHAIRDRLGVGAAAHLSAQLPVLIRGMFFEAWRPMRRRKEMHTVDEFLADIRESFSDDLAFDAEAAFREVISVMRMHISEGEMAKVERGMPKSIRRLWEDEAAT